MKATLHIGTEKTGTTSIQNFLQHNCARLKRQRIAYPQSVGKTNHRGLSALCLDPHKNDDHFQSLGIMDAAQKTRWQREGVRALQSELDSFRGEVDEVVFSSEHLHSRLTNKAEVQRLQDILSGHFSNFRILVYLRRQDELAVSRYSTALRAGACPRHIIPGITNKHHPYFNYFDVVERWASVFGKESISIRIFTPGELVGQDLIADFCDAVGIGDQDNLVRPPRKNEALSARAQMVVLMFNRALQDGRKNTPENQLLRRDLIRELSARFPGASMLPARDDALALYSLFRESNQLLAEQYLDRTELFHHDFSGYPEAQTTVLLDQELIEQSYALILDAMRHRRAGMFAPGTMLGSPGSRQAIRKLLPRPLVRRMRSMPVFKRFVSKP